MSTVRLVTANAVVATERIHKAMGWCCELPREQRPAILISYFYLRQFGKERPHFCFRDWTMDSGAYSAANSGKVIDFDAYNETCAELLASDEQLVEVFALDVIGDWRATLRNTERHWLAGVPAIPTFHVGSPAEALLEMARAYPKIALGGAVGWSAKKKLAWARECFARVWPKRIHGLGMNGERMLMELPFHSVDASSWLLGPAAFGRWQSYGANLSVRGGKQNLRSEVEWYMELEKRLRHRWARQMAELDALPTGMTA